MLRIHCPTVELRKLAIILPVAAGFILGGLPLCAQQPTEKTAKQKIEADAAQIEEWVTQLDDDRYDVRQRAQQKLEQVGQPALDAVVVAAEAGTLESVTRAIDILMKWSEQEDQKLRFEVLQRMANLSDRPREAAMAARLIATAKENAALAALTQMGAEYNRDPRIHGLQNLQVLIGPKWTGGSEGLKHLADVPRATTVSMLAAPIDDTALEQLAKLKSIERLELYSTNVTEAAADEFKKQFPNVKVDFRLGALLGVRGLPHGQGSITEVEPNSAAEKAGIAPGDRITEFNGDKVEDFEALTQRISGHRPGDSATLTVERNGEPRKVKVTFGDWGKSQLNRLNTLNRNRITPNQIRIIQQNRIANPQPAPVQLPRIQPPAAEPKQAKEK